MIDINSVMCKKEEKMQVSGDILKEKITIKKIEK